MAIFVTGDCHGDYSKFEVQNFPEQEILSKSDYVIVCGDFGYWRDNAEQNKKLDWLEKRSFTTLWIDGNHENYDLLKQIEMNKWNGGKVQYIRPSVIHLMRGSVFNIDGCKIFTMGGARSHDIEGGILNPDDPSLNKKRAVLHQSGRNYRINHISWWEEEMPNENEFIEGIKSLAVHDFKVDVILTHEAPAYTKALLEIERSKKDPLSEYLQDIKALTEYKKWYFGHYHRDQAIYADEIAIYERIAQIW